MWTREKVALIKSQPEVWPSFKNRAIKFLNIVTNILDKHKVKWWLADGALLGLHRDGDLIFGDYDIDLSVDISTVTPAVMKEFTDLGIAKYVKRSNARYTSLSHFIHDYETDEFFEPKYFVCGDPVKLYGGKLGVSIDLFFWVTHKDMNYCTWGERMYFVQKPKDIFPLSTISTKYGDFPCPRDLDAYLTWQYRDWRTPREEGILLTSENLSVIPRKKLGVVVYNYTRNESRIVPYYSLLEKAAKI